MSIKQLIYSQQSIIKMKSNVSIARLPDRPKWVMSEMSTMFQMTQHFPKNMPTTWLDVVAFGTLFLLISQI